mgnify:FL=1|tara:strand:- start:556 stop:1005 length:450 start_codon:yes stop_codon:yes gene_type:complete
MPKNPAEPADQENTAPSIDPQKQYLMDQFGNLMEQVGDGFGGPLQEELISRLEQTIADFHEEVNEMLGRLKDNSEKRHEKLKEIWNNPDAVITEAAQSDNDQEDGPGLNTDEMSEWEKKIESSSKEQPSEEKPKEEGKKKKGFFGRKKK